ncbi:spondin domain-containing protein [Cognaticolwellia mytili]|uniref:spondin domain-containing protein n=1 Tax=Cognaticolwellia mytili TaxID=1888913 RepID=UPI000A178476|nr:spondin domain-containing protein [Cognaticolwellia mytili]
MKFIKTASAIALALSSSALMAQELEIKFTNLTQGIYYTPILMSAHDDSMSLFSSGTAATPELQMMAEGGNISGLVTLLEGVNANNAANPAEGLLAPGESTTAMLSTDEGNGYLSVVTMLLPTNDGFAGVSGWKIPTEAGTYTFNVNAYDAGTEANNEVINGAGAPGALGIPVAPGMDAGTGGTGVTTEESNKTVHIHRGSLGDDDLTAGKSDLDNTVHRWLNPVARVTVTVK